MRIMLTGGSEGIGGAALRLLAGEANRRGEAVRIVTTASGRKPRPEKLIADLEGLGAQVLFLTGDLGDAEVARDIAEKSLAFLGGLDLFVSNAGAGKPAPLAQQSLEEWDRMFNLNVRSTFVLAQAFYPALKASHGTIVVVASMSGMQAHLGQAAYAPAKAAVISLVENLAMEWAPDGIRVNAVAPGMIRTPLTAMIYEKEGLEEARSRRVPLGRVGQPEDIAAVIAFLASEGAGYITGQTILADGGVSATGLNNLPS